MKNGREVFWHTFERSIWIFFVSFLFKLYFKKPSKTLSEMFSVYFKIPNWINQNILVSSHKILRLYPKLFVFEPRNQFCSSKQSIPWFGLIFIKYFFGNKPNYMNSKWKSDEFCCAIIIFEGNRQFGKANTFRVNPEKNRSGI